MGVYIKGREMPNNCQECVCINDEYFYCQAVGRQPQDENVVSRRPDWCPLVEVPPHGRLIDADALIEDLERQCKEVFRIDAVSPDDYLDATARTAAEGMSMGTWYKPQEFFKRFFRKKDLREVCREKYGDDFVKMYDMLNDGIPIGNLAETEIFLAMVEAAKDGKT